MSEETLETFEITAEGAAAFGALATQAFNPRAIVPDVGIPIREPDETWELTQGGKGMAWVYRVPGNATLTKPVIIADGFSAGESTVREWASLFEQPEIPEGHRWGTRLHEQGRDVIILGYNSRSAPILDNAEVAIECILKAISERSGSEPLVVGGLSMGGLVTRYALAKMESENIDHEVKTYFSYDSPHQGAWIPISLQVFAHFLFGLADALYPNPTTPENIQAKKDMQGMSLLMNSQASRQLLWKHTATHLNLPSPFEPQAAAERGDFLEALQAVGNWPSKPVLVGVANGRGDGEGLEGIEPGDKNLDWAGTPGVTLYTQDAGDAQLVATLRRATLQNPVIDVKTTGIPALDGAPGGTLESFGIAADAINKKFTATVEHRDVCFVPVASAVDLADPSDPYIPVNDMDKDAGGLEQFKVASQNEGHTLITQELCDWLDKHF
jgi:hypothetical protein